MTEAFRTLRSLAPSAAYDSYWRFAADRQAVPLDAHPDGVLLASAAGFVFRPGEVELDGESVAILTLT